MQFVEFVAKLFPTSCNAMFRWLTVSRTLEVSYLTNLALLPWSKFPPFPWLHENAQWSDPVFAFTAVLWAIQCWRENRRPRAEGVYLAMAVYAGAGTLSFFFASAHQPAGALKLLGLAELLMLAVITSDLARRPHFPRAMAWTLAISCIVVASASLLGLALFYAGVWTPLIGLYGDHLVPSSWYARVRSVSGGPNVLASFCTFAAAVISAKNPALPRRLERLTQWALSLTVALTISHGILGFILAATIRKAGTQIRKIFALVLGIAFVIPVSSLIFLNLSLDPVQPWGSRVDPARPSGRWQTVTSTLETIREHPLWGLGPGTPPGRFYGMPYDAHMTLLDIAGTLGIPAAVAFVGLFALLWRRRARPTNLFLWGAFAGFALDSLVCDIEDFRHVWVMIGLADADSKQQKAECSRQ